MSQGIRPPKEQRDRIIRAYRDGDRELVKSLLSEFGLNPRYASLIARQAGIRTREPTTRIRATKNRMWERAIANGALVR